MDNFKSLYQIKKRRHLLSNISNHHFSKKSIKIINPKNNSHYRYLKLYNTQSSEENSLIKEKIKIKAKDQKKFDILKKVFQKPIKKEKVLTKLTKAKLPFSTRKEIDPEIKKAKIKSLKPNPKYHNFSTIKWLRRKYSNSVLEKSINTLLPDNGKPVIPDDESEEDKKHRELIEFLESLKPIIEKEKNVNINPKYFFDKITYEKILKLKEIFLEFDEDGSRKMELDEMYTMFNQNNIFADLNELVNLFFKNNKPKKKNIMNLYLDFYQFMQFALNKEQDFRNFMREIKKKYKKDKNHKFTDENESIYLPMSFNLILDYFIAKGKERSAIDEIKKSMNNMDDILNKGIKRKKLLNLSFCNNNKQNSHENRIFKRLSIIKPNIHRLTIRSIKDLNNDEESSSEDKDNNKYKYNEQLEKINFKDPIKEFEKLFKAHGVNLAKKNIKLNLNNNSHEKKINKNYCSTHNSILSDNSTSYGKTPTGNILMNNNNNIKVFEDSKDSISGNISKNNETKNNDISEDNSIITDIVNNYLNMKFIKQIKKNNYDKFHNIKVAIDTSNKEIDSIKKLMKNKEIKNNTNNINIFNNNNYSKDNIDYYNNSFFKNKKLKNFNKKNKFNLINSNKKDININPYIKNSSYLGSKNKKNKLPSVASNKTNDFTINEYFTKNIGNNSNFNNTYHNFKQINNNKMIKLNKMTSFEESINKMKYNYVPLELYK